MTRIKIKDLPKNIEVNSEEMKMVMGGASYYPLMIKTKPSGYLILEPENMTSAYNSSLFSLRKSEVL